MATFLIWQLAASYLIALPRLVPASSDPRGGSLMPTPEDIAQLKAAIQSGLRSALGLGFSVQGDEDEAGDDPSAPSVGAVECTAEANAEVVVDGNGGQLPEG